MRSTTISGFSMPFKASPIFLSALAKRIMEAAIAIMPTALICIDGANLLRSIATPTRAASAIPRATALGAISFGSTSLERIANAMDSATRVPASSISPLVLAPNEAASIAPMVFDRIASPTPIPSNATPPLASSSQSRVLRRYSDPASRAMDVAT